MRRQDLGKLDLMDPLNMISAKSPFPTLRIVICLMNFFVLISRPPPIPHFTHLRKQQFDKNSYFVINHRAITFIVLTFDFKNFLFQFFNRLVDLINYNENWCRSNCVQNCVNHVLA